MEFYQQICISIVGVVAMIWIIADGPNIYRVCLDLFLAYRAKIKNE